MGTATHPFPDGRAARIAGSLLKLHSPHEIAEAVEIMIEVLDLLGGDPDAEVDDEDRCSANDDDLRIDGINLDGGPGDPDDAEDSDEDCCPAGDDGCGLVLSHGTVHYGSHHDEEPLIPTYGVDQTKEPEPWAAGVCNSLMSPHLERIRDGPRGVGQRRRAQGAHDGEAPCTL